MIGRRKLLIGVAATCGCGSVRTPYSAASVLLQSTGQLEVLCAGADRRWMTRADDPIEPAPEAAKIIQRMTQSIGLDVPFTVGKSEVASGAYADRRGNELLIVYDRNEYDFENGWLPYTSLFIFAHEVGHHVSHPHIQRGGGSTHAKERAADRFAGAALARLGASLDQTLAWPRETSEDGSDTHPPRTERIAAATAGWHEAQYQLRWQRTAHCKPDWAGDVIEVGGRQCRLVQACDADGPETKLACQADNGQWIWK